MDIDDVRPRSGAVSSKAALVSGFVSGILVLCTVGFFVLLSVMLGEGEGLGAAGVPSSDGIAAAPTAPTVPSAAQPEEKVGVVKPIAADDHVSGNKDAAVTAYLWSDFECPYCGSFHATVNRLMDEYGDKVALVYRHFPLSYHVQAVPAANAAECAAEQGKFWEFADGVYAGQSRLGDAYYDELAGKLGLDGKKFSDCYASKKYGGKISADARDGSAAGVSGTPSMVIVAADGSKRMVPGAVPYAQLKAEIDVALAAE